MTTVRSGVSPLLVVATVLFACARAAQAQCPAPPSLAAPENRAYARSGAAQQAAPENGGRPSVTAMRLTDFQYDTQSAVLGCQSRFRWILTPGNDLYVYNHNWLDDPVLDRFSTLDKRVASKVLYTYRF